MLDLARTTYTTTTQNRHSPCVLSSAATAFSTTSTACFDPTALRLLSACAHVRSNKRKLALPMSSVVSKFEHCALNLQVHVFARTCGGGHTLSAQDLGFVLPPHCGCCCKRSPLLQAPCCAGARAAWCFGPRGPFWLCWFLPYTRKKARGGEREGGAEKMTPNRAFFSSSHMRRC